MLDPSQIAAIADELADADRKRTTVPLLTARNPGMTVEDAYAVQREWAHRGVSAGRRIVGRKIGLTSKVMQAATGITEPDYGVIFDDMVIDSGASVEFDRFSNVRIEVELAFVLRDRLEAWAAEPAGERRFLLLDCRVSGSVIAPYQHEIIAVNTR